MISNPFARLSRFLTYIALVVSVLLGSWTVTVIAVNMPPAPYEASEQDAAWRSASTFHFRGRQALRKGNKVKAIEFLEKALEAYKKLNSSEKIREVKNDLEDAHNLP